MRKFEIIHHKFGYYVGTLTFPCEYIRCDFEVATLGSEVGQDEPTSVWFSTREKAEHALMVAQLRGDAL